MKNKILSKFPGQSFFQYTSLFIYIADYTNQTGGVKGLESSETKPIDIDSFQIDNHIGLDVTFCPFKENTIKLNKKELQHCEGILYPTENNEKNWTLLLELKYPKLKNLGANLKEARDQLFETLSLFRDQGIIEPRRLVYLISSAPKYSIRVPFNNFSMSSGELKKIRKEKNAIVKGTNGVEILSSFKLKL